MLKSWHVSAPVHGRTRCSLQTRVGGVPYLILMREQPMNNKRRTRLLPLGYMECTGICAHRKIYCMYCMHGYLVQMHNTMSHHSTLTITLTRHLSNMYGYIPARLRVDWRQTLISDITTDTRLRMWNVPTSAPWSLSVFMTFLFVLEKFSNWNILA